jgi:hypothetical protein
MAKRATQRKRSEGRTSQSVGDDAFKTFTSAAIDLGTLDPTFTRIDLEFTGIDHAGVSYEARVFLDNAEANQDTPEDDEHGYVGAFHIFGHGGCFGDVGHCDITGLPRPYDPRPAHPLTPATKVVIATDAINLAMQRKKKSVTITIVPVILSGTPRCNYENFMKFDRVALVAYR